jgi:hypothetical protein
MKADGSGRDEQQGERVREENLRKESWQRVKSGVHCKAEFQPHLCNSIDTQHQNGESGSPSRPPGSRSGSPESFSPGVDALESHATGDGHIPGETGEQR